jgi:hypothetical protein
MKTRTDFAYRIDKLDAAGEIEEHLAGVEDFQIAEAAYEAAIRRHPKAGIQLRQRARVISDSRRPRLAK